ncbi:hypothetical protein GCK72_000428 [Caenorhabditis remanei]|uniref:BTB domain-containing protein n=1 Tax=Caenorhabditis remanei TaxID=31234 RepID=A0A6A5HPL9_CAERE|nr:hypothetical protein GCK72_000428 [Caenorhabditis remanei]KAF1768616.1 hypothetical protein GCK72_000428 [Caenorhabditis remanei]
MLLDKQKNLERSNLEIVEKLRLCDEKIDRLSNEYQEKFDLIQSKLNEIVETLKSEESSKFVESDNSTVTTAPVDSTQDFQKNEEMTSTSGKNFVLKHTFNNVSSIKNEEDRYSEMEEHFGVPWQIGIRQWDGFLSFYLRNLFRDANEKKWETEVEYELKIVSPNCREKKEERTTKSFKSDDTVSGWGSLKFIEWNNLNKDFVVDDCFCAEIAMKMKKMTGIYKDNLRSFDKTMEEYADVVLVVNDEKFFVSKLYLATHYSYFKTLFLGQFNEAKKTEIKLSGIDADDFQNYLEVLYGEQAINEITVEGILMVADMYDTSFVIQKCETFLQRKSKKTMKKKLQLSSRYNLDALKKQCLGEIKSVADIKSLIPGDIHDLDPSIMAEFLLKALSVHDSN